MSKLNYPGNSTYRVRQVPRSAWATNIESILRLTQRNLSGCTRDPGNYQLPVGYTSIEKFPGENLSAAMARQRAEPAKEYALPPAARRNFSYAPKVFSGCT